MGEYFKPRRRKIGVVTLMMACVFMAAWIRCFYYEDWSFVRFGNTQYLLRSDRGGFSCNKWYGPLPKGVSLHGTQPVMRVAILATGPAPRDDLFVYYSGVAIPLTVLSAFLLLKKPRKSTQNKALELVANEGATS